MVTHCNHLVPTTFTIFKCPSFVPCSFLDCMGLAFYISRYYFHCIHSLRWSFFPPIAWLVHFFCIQKLFQPQASQRSKASPKAWVIFRCFCTVSFTASRAWISGGIVPMNPCNETFKESHLGIVNISSQQVSLQHCCVAAFTPILVTSSTLASLFNSGSIDIQQSLNTSSPWSKLKTGVSPLG